MVRIARRVDADMFDAELGPDPVIAIVARPDLGPDIHDRSSLPGEGACYTLRPLVVTGSSPIYTICVVLSINEMVMPRGEHASGANRSPLPNSAAIPLPAGLPNRYQGAELHCFFAVGGRFLDAETDVPCCEGHLTPG
jgi:hypothetical protein